MISFHGPRFYTTVYAPHFPCMPYGTLARRYTDAYATRAPRDAGRFRGLPSPRRRPCSGFECCRRGRGCRVDRAPTTHFVISARQPSSRSGACIVRNQPTRTNPPLTVLSTWQLRNLSLPFFAFVLLFYTTPRTQRTMANTVTETIEKGTQEVKHAGQAVTNEVKAEVQTAVNKDGTC